MPNAVNLGTGNIPLEFAGKLTDIVKNEWKSGRLLDNVTAVTQELLKYWFMEPFKNSRNYNFHEGQQQAILNTIYLHEVLKANTVKEMYTSVDEKLLSKMGKGEVENAKYNYPKYAIKMATGTGKTWVMHALLIWQYLNAKLEDAATGRYSKNFLLVAPGLIVYERLVEAYLGKLKGDNRDFESSDIKKYKELFIPPSYRNVIFGFIQNNVAVKNEIGKNPTGEGIIAITNWHLLVGEDEEGEDDNFSTIAQDILPITPGKSQGHSLNELDNNFLRGREMQYLSKLDNLVVINDEAHHIHEIKSGGDASEVEWQKSLKIISKNKFEKFIQIDFSATPYNITGSGQKRTKHYFPHVIVDFNIKEAIHRGLIKTIAIDKRKELASKKLASLDFKAVREGNRVIGLSEGQKIMLRAGVEKLKILEEQFIGFMEESKAISNKYPKMLIVCEDTQVTSYVVDYLTKYEGLEDEDVIQVDSDKKGDISDKQWGELKEKLFNVDSNSKPKVIVSVLMLREGFDVSNICVIVALRSTESSILLEQIIGRGLRLMWRENEYEDIKKENREKLLELKEEPNNYMDILSIIEHPRFMEFYKDLIQKGEAGEVGEIEGDRNKILGDIINVSLNKNFNQYDIYIPVILKDREEVVFESDISIDKLEPFTLYTLSRLKRFIDSKEEMFYSEEVTVRTRFGNYKVPHDMFNSNSYNEYISKILKAVTSTIEKVDKKTKYFPNIQFNIAKLTSIIDNYIRKRLFDGYFDPFEDSNWRVLLLSKTGIVEHMIKEISKAIYEMQNNIEIEEAVVLKKYFSSVPTLRMRKNYSIAAAKCIYERIQYPSNKGEVEKNFILFADSDAEVKAFVKVNEYYHKFASISYIREDGIIASYYPDFIVKFKDEVYLVETKAQKDINNANVISKQNATVNWLKKINELKAEDRMYCKWSYVLLDDETFYSMRDNGASLRDILEFKKI